MEKKDYKILFLIGGFLIGIIVGASIMFGIICLSFRSASINGTENANWFVKMFGSVVKDAKEEVEDIFADEIAEQKEEEAERKKEREESNAEAEQKYNEIMEQYKETTKQIEDERKKTTDEANSKYTED